MPSPATKQNYVKVLSESDKIVENSNFSKDRSPDVASEKEDSSINSGSSNVDTCSPKKTPVGDTESTNNNNTLPHPWSAVWEPNYNCYYYWNSETNETTYIHPNSVKLLNLYLVPKPLRMLQELLSRTIPNIIIQTPMLLLLVLKILMRHTILIINNSLMLTLLIPSVILNILNS